LIYRNPSKKIFPEDFFGLPNNSKDIFSNFKISSSERKNVRIIEHPKLLNPLSPKNKKEFAGINSIKEELGEESLTYHECSDNNNDCQIQFKNNKIQNNISNEERHSTGSTKTQISSTKSNNSTPEVCKIFNKNDNTPIENEDLLKITPHFINEKPNNIQLNFKNNNNNKKSKFERPLTPNLNLIRKSSVPMSENTENKFVSKRINNDKGYLMHECKKQINNEKIKNNPQTDKKLSQVVTKTDINVKRRSLSSTKTKIMSNCNNLHTDSINENNYKKNKKINKYYNYHHKSNKNIYNSINNPNSNSKNKNPFPFNNNRNMQSRKKISNKSDESQTKQQRKNSTKTAKRNSNSSMNKSISKKKDNKNINNSELRVIDRLKPFRSENKIRIVHSQVNDEINILFNGLSDNIAKDPEIHNKIECLIKDIKDIQQVVNRKTQTHFRPRKQHFNNSKIKEENFNN
jgi:hypothetical protein